MKFLSLVSFRADDGGSGAVAVVVLLVVVVVEDDDGDIKFVIDSARTLILLLLNFSPFF
jgi:hypothetical protein